MLHNLLYYQVSPTTYQWIMALHIVAVISWFAGLFYLPRLFVYHAMTKNQATSETFKVMEYKLNYYIMHPAMAVTFLTGILLMHFCFIKYGDIPAWLIWKLVFVLFLFIFQVCCGFHIRRFKKDCNTYSHRYFRYFNEIPTLLLILITILVVVKP